WDVQGGAESLGARDMAAGEGEWRVGGIVAQRDADLLARGGEQLRRLARRRGRRLGRRRGRLRPARSEARADAEQEGPAIELDHARIIARPLSQRHRGKRLRGAAGNGTGGLSRRVVGSRFAEAPSHPDFLLLKGEKERGRSARLTWQIPSLPPPASPAAGPAYAARRRCGRRTRRGGRAHTPGPACRPSA